MGFNPLISISMVDDLPDAGNAIYLHSNPASPPNSNPPTSNPNPETSNIFFLPKLHKHRKPNHNNSRLIIAVLVHFADGTKKKMKALVDTGAEVNVIRRDLVDPSLLKPSPHPIRLGAANSTQLCGGFHEVEMVLSL